jgi:hypothetical protein
MVPCTLSIARRQCRRCYWLASQARRPGVASQPFGCWRSGGVAELRLVRRELTRAPDNEATQGFAACCGLSERASRVPTYPSKAIGRTP